MPCPDPLAIGYDETPDGRPRIIGEVWPSTGPFAGNPRHRRARINAVARKVLFNNWTCLHCGDPVPLWRRADAVYCTAGCKKRAKYARTLKTP